MKPILCKLGFHRYRRIHGKDDAGSYSGGSCERCGDTYKLHFPKPGKIVSQSSFTKKGNDQ